MQDFLNKIRQRSVKDKKLIALAVSGGIVALIFSVWATSLISRITEGPEEIVLKQAGDETQSASVIDSIKRKASLIFGEGSPLGDIDFRGFSKPIEYNSEDRIDSQNTDEEERNLDAILEEFKKGNEASSSPLLEEEFESENSEISF